MFVTRKQAITLYASQEQLAILPLSRIEQRGSVGVFWRKNDLPSDALQRFLAHLLKVKDGD